MLISPKTTSRFEIKFYMNWQNIWESWTKSPISTSQRNWP